MPATPSMPIYRELVPAGPPTTPDGFERIRQPLLGGLPARIVLDDELTLALTVPTGLAVAWRDAESTTVVASSDQGLAPHTPGIVDDAVARAPLRFVLVRARSIVCAMPLVVGLRRRIPDDGGDTGAKAEILVLGYRIYAGNVRGTGDYGSYVDFAWRRADAGVDTFVEPPLDPRVAAGLPTQSTMQSELALSDSDVQPRPRWRLL